MRRDRPRSKVKAKGTRGSFGSVVMKRKNFFAVALAAAAAPLFIVLSAKADLAQLNDGAPFVVIKSTGGQGQITVRPSEPNGLVRIPGSAPGVRMERFNVNSTERIDWPKIGGGGQCGAAGFRGRFRPCIGGAVHLPLNNLPEGPHGVFVTNPGGDLPIGVPNRFQAMVISAGTSPVLMEQTRGPFFIDGESDITLHGVAGRGLVRTTTGTVSIRNPGGGIRIETASGRILMQSGPALDQAQIGSQQGDIEWTINGVGQGPYRVFAGSGIVKLLVRPGIALNIDAVSTGGTVINDLDPAMATVIFARPHAVSLAVGGGGAQITVQSQSGTVIIAPAQL